MCPLSAPLASLPVPFLCSSPALYLSSVDIEKPGLNRTCYFGLGNERGPMRPGLWGGKEKESRWCELWWDKKRPLTVGRSLIKSHKWVLLCFLHASSRIWRRQVADWTHLVGLSVRRGHITYSRFVCPTFQNANIQNIRVWSKKRFIDLEGTSLRRQRDFKILLIHLKTA